MQIIFAAATRKLVKGKKIDFETWHSFCVIGFFLITNGGTRTLTIFDATLLKVFVMHRYDICF